MMQRYRRLKETPRVGQGAAGQGASSGWVCVDKTRAPVAVPACSFEGGVNTVVSAFAEIKRLSNR